ncbi:MAG: hypothetical protein N2050_10285 [Flavobacteriales bacterium]|nr:hypothetical protein [Flavobacteriales bacterium]MCX7650920.1 hypothetical protein [Flavobacteriales bacterium]MDW8432826.1 hypothetical protein [Flavobacteriales bacterium]
MINPWLSLILASMMEVGWLFSLKFLSFQAIKNLRIHDLMTQPETLKVLAPLAGYVGFGLANIVLFNAALRHIAAPTAFAIWMGLALTGSTLLEMLLGSLRFSWYQIFFTALILAGIVGLKFTAGNEVRP